MSQNKYFSLNTSLHFSQLGPSQKIPKLSNNNIKTSDRNNTQIIDRKNQSKYTTHNNNQNNRFEFNDQIQSNKQQLVPNKHYLIQLYKQTQKQKTILKNKLNILNRSFLNNNKKAKSIQNSLKRINQIKTNYHQSQSKLQQQIKKNKQKQQIKLQQIFMRKQQNKQKLPLIKSLVHYQRSSQYYNMKRQSRIIQTQIQFNNTMMLSQRKKNAQFIKQNDQIVPYKRHKYIQNKVKKAKNKDQKVSRIIQKKLLKSRIQIQQMRNLQQSLMSKFNSSRTKLNSSMTKMKSQLRY